MAIGENEFRSFPETRWSLVAGMGAAATPDVKRQAMAELVARYRPAFLKHLVVSKGIDMDDAEDLVQGFVTTRILERDVISRAAQSKGKLRSFLVRVLQNYVEDWRRSRKGKTATAELEEERDASPPPAADEYDIEWARIVLTATFDRMKAECREKGRMHVWQVFSARVVSPTLDGTPMPSYDDMVRKYGFASPKEANNLLVNAKRAFVRLLEEVIGEYVPQDEAEEELADLKRILSNAGTGAALARVLSIGLGSQPIWTTEELAAMRLNEPEE